MPIKMRKILSVMLAASAAFFIASAQAQNVGTVTNHAIPIGKGPGVQGFSSALCTSAQLLVGQTSADPLCKTITGDFTLSAAGVAAITKITLGSDADGDIYYRSGGVLVRLPVGANGKILQVSGGFPSWQNAGSASSITDASTSIASGTNDTLLLNNSGTLGHTAYTNTTLASVVDKINTVKSNFYVATTGTDSGDCTNSGAPCLHIAYAALQALKSNSGNGNQTVHLAAGTYTEDVVISGMGYNAGTNGQSQQLIFSGAGSGSTIWDTNSTAQCGVLTANYGANISVTAMTMRDTGSTSCKSLLFANLGGFINVLSGMNFGAVHQSHFFCEEPGSLIEIWNNISITGPISPNPRSHAQANTGCLIEYASSTLTFNGTTITWGTGFFEAHDFAIVYLNSFGQVNSTSGPRYFADTGLINTNGVGCSSTPGSSAGSTANSGICK